MTTDVNKCDDGNQNPLDGCSATCTVEDGWSCTGGTTTSKDTCVDKCGDGKVMKTSASYCDDGNTNSGDG